MDGSADGCVAGMALVGLTILPVHIKSETNEELLPRSATELVYTYNRFECGASGFAETVVQWAMDHPIEMMLIGIPVGNFVNAFWSKLKFWTCKKKRKGAFENEKNTPISFDPKKFQKNFSKMMNIEVFCFQLTEFAQGVVPSDEESALKEKRFVKAIMDIDYSQMIPSAVQDYWKTDMTIAKYFRDDFTYLSSLETYKGDLSQKLMYAKEEKKLDAAGKPEAEKILLSKHLYLLAMQWKAMLRQGLSFTQK